MATRSHNHNRLGYSIIFKRAAIMKFSKVKMNLTVIAIACLIAVG